MKYYDEVKMQPIREALEAEVLTWPDVGPKEMMGCLVYFRGRSFFAFLVTHGLVLTKLADPDRTTLSRRRRAKPFDMAGRTSSKWIQLPVRTPKDLVPLLPYVRRSYEAIASR